MNGTLTWTIEDYADDGRPVGSMTIRDGQGEWTLSFGDGHEWVTEALARDHARARRLDFVHGS